MRGKLKLILKISFLCNFFVIFNAIKQQRWFLHVFFSERSPGPFSSLSDSLGTTEDLGYLQEDT